MDYRLSYSRIDEGCQVVEQSDSLASLVAIAESEVTNFDGAFISDGEGNVVWDFGNGYAEIEFIDGIKMFVF